MSKRSFEMFSGATIKKLIVVVEMAHNGEIWAQQLSPQYKTNVAEYKTKYINVLEIQRDQIPVMGPNKLKQKHICRLISNEPCQGQTN